MTFGKSVALGTILIFGAAHATEFHLHPSFQVSQIYNDNIFGTSTGETRDLITVLQPGIALRLENLSSKHLLSYSPIVELFWYTGGQNALSHIGSYQSNFDVNPRFSLSLAERMAYSTSVTTELFPESAAEVQQARIRTFRSVTEVTPLFRITEDTDLQMRSQFWVYDFEVLSLTPPGSTFTPVDTFQATEIAQLDHRMDERNTLSPSLGFSHFWYVDAPDVSLLRGDVNWKINWTPTFLTDFKVGIAQTLRDEGSGGATLLVGGADAERKFAEGSLRASYDRSIVSSSGLGDALIQDTATLGGNWRFAEDWSLLSSGSYFYSFSLNAASDMRVHGLYTEARLTYQLLPSTDISLGYIYRLQNATGGRAISFDRNQAYLRVAYSPELF